MLTRRSLLHSAAAGLAPTAIQRQLYRRAPAGGAAVMEYAYYTRPRGGAMLSIETHWSRSDTVDSAWYRLSEDYGRTWSDPQPRRVSKRLPTGVWRMAPRGVFPDPTTGHTLEFWQEAQLPTDDPLEGLRRWSLWYAISTGGGRTRKLTRQIIQHGEGFTGRHPFPGIHIGSNCLMLGDVASTPLFLSDGSLLLPAIFPPLAAGGTLYNPANAYTYTNAAILRGYWHNGELRWTLGATIAADPAQSTRGMDEPTLALLDNGAILCILRGSNDRRPSLPGRKWISISADHGRTFSKPAPWTWSGGENFFSPSACSQLVAHSSGRLFWLGNITRDNPRGNRPRYPFVIAEVDRHYGLPLRKTVRTVDDLHPGEDPMLSLSNFYAREDRQTGAIHLHMTRLFASASKPWAGDAYLYRIPID